MRKGLSRRRTTAFCPASAWRWSIGSPGNSGIPIVYRDLGVEELAAADELLLTSTPFCLLPATRFNGKPVGDGQPGPVFSRLLDAFSHAAGIDIAAQAVRFATR